LENQIKTLEYVNGEFARQENQLREEIETLKGRLGAQHSEPMVVIPARSVSPTKSVSTAKSVSPAKSAKRAESEDSESAEDQLRIRPVRETKGKGKAAVQDEPNPKEARAEMKVLMKTIPKEYQLRVDEVFSSSKNKEISGRLIPKLLNSMAPRFNSSRKQIHEWLGALHRHQRGRYRKVETGKLDADNRRLHANSRLNEVRIIKFLSIYSLLLYMY
jgi:hypothetical protein